MAFVVAKNKTCGLGTTQVLDYQDFQVIRCLIKGILLYHNLVLFFLVICHTIVSTSLGGEQILWSVYLCVLYAAFQRS
jgi:hypothetical protein